MAGNFYSTFTPDNGGGGGGGSGVTSLNTLFGDLTLATGPGISISSIGTTITIDTAEAYANNALSNLVAPVAFNVDLLPGTSNVRNIGSNTKKLGQMFISTLLHTTGGASINLNGNTGTLRNPNGSVALQFGSSGHSLNSSTGSGMLDFLNPQQIVLRAPSAARTALLFNDNGTGTNSVGFQSPVTITTSTTWALPVADGTSGQVLSTDGAANLSWVTAGGSGANTALSNLATTAINTDLVIGSTGAAVNGVFKTANQTASMTNSSTLTIGTGDAIGTTSLSGNLVLNTGAIGSSAGINSGNISLLTSDSPGGLGSTAGVINLKPGLNADSTRAPIQLLSTVLLTTGTATRYPLLFTDSGATKTVGFIAPATITTPVTWALPPADGTVGQVLSTDGAGNLSFASAGSGANTALSNLTATAINTNLLSDAGGTRNLGGAGNSWNVVFANVLTGANGSSQIQFTGGGSTGLLFDDAAAVALVWSSSQRKLVASDQSANLDFLTPHQINMPNDGTTPTSLLFRDNSSTKFIGFKAPASVTSSVAWTLPNGDGQSTQAIATDGAGNLTFQSFAANDLSNLSSTGTDVTVDLVSNQDAPILDTFPSLGNSDTLGTTTTKLAEPFTPNNNMQVGTAQLGVVNATLVLSGNLFADIYTDSAGSPGTSIGTSDAVVASSLDGGVDSVAFTFSTPVSLSGGTPYWLVVYGDSTYNAGSDHLPARVGSSGSVGARFTGSWSAMATPIAIRVGTGLPNQLGENGSPWLATWSDVMNLTPLTSDPTDAVQGTVYYNSGTNKLKFFDGSSWHIVTSV